MSAPNPPTGRQRSKGGPSRSPAEPSGIVVVDKPGGMTSHDVVDEVRRRFGTRKVGHAGTLDPDATGVLVVGLGRATRLLDYAHAHPKRYLAEARFGVTTTTQDASGEAIARRRVQLQRAALESALDTFTGEIDQVPPMVSAVKVSGERLYAKARRGEVVDRPARRVHVHELRLRSFAPGDEARAVLDVRCSAGTYVRTLVHDLGDHLGCGAHLGTLRRTEAGGFDISEAVPLSSLTRSALLGVTEAVRGMETLDVDEDAAAGVRHGRPLEVSAGGAAGPRVAVTHQGALLAVYRRNGRRWVPERVIV